MKEMFNYPLITIITVVYNDKANIEETVLSVLDNQYPNKEYVVIDGASNDGTLEIVKKYDNEISFILSEKDAGIYDAMNKGIKYSNGKWLIFMNSGDTFFDDSCLLSLDSLLLSDTGVIYGNTYRRSESTISVPQKLDFLKKGTIHGCHQSMLFNKSVLGSELFFRTYFKLAGDSELLARLYSKKFEMFYAEVTIANYMGDGVSSLGNVKRKTLWKERIQRVHYVYKYFGLNAVLKLLFQYEK